MINAPPQVVVETKTVTVVDDAQIKLLQTELTFMREQNNELQAQIEFLNKFQAEQRDQHAAQVKTLEAKASEQSQQIASLDGSLKNAQSEIDMLRSSMISGSQNMQGQVDEYRKRLEAEMAQSRQLNVDKNQILAEKEALAQQKQQEIDQLKASFTSQAKLLSDEIASLKSDLENLRRSKEGALTEVTSKFNSQIQQLEAKYEHDIKAKETELGKCNVRIAELERQTHDLSYELEQLRKEYEQKAGEASKLSTKIKDLEVAVADAVKIKQESELIKAENA